ncbi:MAG: DUF4440 domain-containing protein [Gemmatimonadota bacterium]
MRLLLLACWTGAVTPLAAQLPDTAATRAQLLTADRDLARAVAQRGNSAFLAALEPGAAVVMPGQLILRGEEAGTPVHARYDSPSVYQWTPVHAVADLSGSFGCTVGVSTFLEASDSSHTRRLGRYITCWQRTASGTWRVVGHQRSDRQFSPPDAELDTTLSPAPHSAVFTDGGDAHLAALEVETRYGLMGGNGAAGPGPAFVAYAAEDAVLMPSNEVANGPAEIAEVFRDWVPTNVLEWQPDRRFGYGGSGLAFTTGNSLTWERSGAGRVLRRGHFLTVWRQEPDGRWLYIFDLGSPRPPLPGER